MPARINGGAVINQTINVQNGGDLTAITQAIKRGTVEALEFAHVAYKAGAKRNKYVGKRLVVFQRLQRSFVYSREEYAAQVVIKLPFVSLIVLYSVHGCLA